MKYILFLLVASCSSFLHASDTLQFFNGTYAELLEESAKADKPVLLYFHTSFCGSCKAMERDVFTDTSVIEYYNQAYLLLDVNTGIGEGKQLGEQYSAILAPSFVYLNSQGIEAHRIVGKFPVDEFIRAGKVALDEDESLEAYKAKYEEGERSSEFLFDYCHALRDAAISDSAVITQYLESLSEEEANSESTIAFIYEFSFVNHDAVFGFDSPAMQRLIANKARIYDRYDTVNVESRILFTAVYDVRSAIAAKDEEKFESIVAYIKNHQPDSPMLMFPEVDGRHTMAIYFGGIVESYELTQLLCFRETEDVFNYLEQQVPNPDTTSSRTLSHYSAIIDRYGDNPEVLSLGAEWMELALDKDESYLGYSTYASLLFKLERYEEAKAAVIKSIELGEADDYYCAREEALLERIEAVEAD